LGRITAKTGARTGNLPCPCPLQPTLMGRAASDSAKFPGWSLRPACRQTSASSIRENRVRVVHSVMRRRDGLVSKLLWSGYPKVDACPGIPGRRACGAAGYADARGTYLRRSTDKQEYSTENQGLVNGAYAATHGMVTSARIQTKPGAAWSLTAEKCLGRVERRLAHLYSPPENETLVFLS
jgi:hypothetical protein